ncbi:MAG: hypothetical protein RXR06_10545 [Thermoproteus sp.]
MRLFGFGLRGRGLLAATSDYLWAKRLEKVALRLLTDAFLADADYLLAGFSLNDYGESRECYWSLAFRFEDGRSEGVHDVARFISINLCIYSLLWLNEAPIETGGSSFIVRIENTAYSPAFGLGNYFAKNMTVVDSWLVGTLV